MTTGSQPVLVLGGGINGSAIARELLLNGVPVWLVDAADVASGATAGSSRLIHGGLRYLEYGEFDLVKESLAERTRLLRLAPQFVRPLRLWIPAASRFGGAIGAPGRFFGWNWWPTPAPKSGRGVWLIRAGLTLYDVYARDPSVPKHQVWGASAPAAPPVDRRRYRWLCSYYDGQCAFPERLVQALLEDARLIAAERGLDFQVLTYHSSTLAGDTVEFAAQEPTGAAPSQSGLRPRAIVNATGAWVDETLARLHVPAERLMGGTKGSHLFSFQPRLREAVADQGIYAEAEDGRPIFITPLADAVLIGTTDVPIDGPPERAVTTDRERDYLIESVNKILPEVRLTADDVDFHTSAVRPLPFVPASSPAAITRRHSLVRHDKSQVPLFSVVGGKLTTMRALAELTTAAVIEAIGGQLTASSRERVIPGGDDYPTPHAALVATWQAIADRTGLPQSSVAAVWQLYGTRTMHVLAASPEKDLVPDTSLPLVAVRFSVRNEWVATLADLVERRFMLLYHQRLTRRCLGALAGILVEEGKLQADLVDAVVAAETERLAAHYGKRVS